MHDRLGGRADRGGGDGTLHFLVDGRRDFDVGAEPARRQDDGVFAERLAPLRTMRTLRLAGTSFQASTCRPGTLTRKKRASAARSAGGVSSTAGSPPRS